MASENMICKPPPPSTSTPTPKLTSGEDACGFFSINFVGAFGKYIFLLYFNNYWRRVERNNCDFSVASRSIIISDLLATDKS